MRTLLAAAFLAALISNRSAIAEQDAIPNPAGTNAAPVEKLGGSITGKVVLAAEKAPKRKKIKTDADPVCQDLHKEEPLLGEELVTKDVGGENRLQWAVVYVSSNVEGKFEAPKEPATIDQNGCHYVPHIVTLMVNQPLKIRNSDPTMHNIHAMPQVNKEFNFGQSKAGSEETKSFDQKELGFKIKCDVHPWMLAYGFVFDHPFFAVTGEDGTYTIKNVPAGQYKLTFWHEKFGEQVVDVKVEDGKAATSDAKFEEKK